jgi:nicotinamidase-related amidase
MSDRDSKDIDEIFAEGVEVDQAVQEAFRDAVRRHRLEGRKMVIWRDGKVCHVSPEELESAEEAA